MLSLPCKIHSAYRSLNWLGFGVTFRGCTFYWRTSGGYLTQLRCTNVSQDSID